MKHLGGTDTVDDRDSKLFVEPLPERSGKGLARRDRASYRGKVEARRAGHLHHRRVEAGHAIENRGSVGGDDFEGLFGIRPLSQQHCLRPHSKRKVQPVAEAVGEEEFGSRKGSILRSYLQNPFGEVLQATHHVAVSMDCGLRLACAARRIKPEGGRIGVRRRRFSARRTSCQGITEALAAWLHLPTWHTLGSVPDPNFRNAGSSLCITLS